MRKFYYLSTCDTCKRIMAELNLPPEIELQDIKKEPISEEELNHLKTLTGNYEMLFSKRAQLYKQRDLKNKDPSEDDFQNLLLEHYTFLKRPVLVLGNDIFVGNAKKTVEAAKKKVRETNFLEDV